MTKGTTSSGTPIYHECSCGVCGMTFAEAFSPETKHFTKDCLADKAREFLKAEVHTLPGLPKEPYHRDLGLLYHFVCSLFDNETRESTDQPH